MIMYNISARDSITMDQERLVYTMVKDPRHAVRLARNYAKTMHQYNVTIRAYDIENDDEYMRLKYSPLIMSIYYSGTLNLYFGENCKPISDRQILQF